MDTDTIDRVRETLQETAIGYTLTEVIVFGSRARGDHRPESDVDVLLVSPDFEGLPT
jgi:predicted nucleotidyltransferase